MVVEDCVKNATPTFPLARISWVLLHLYIWILSAVLLGAFWVQFVWGEAPCTLCLLQRMCMILATLGPVWVLASPRRSEAEAWWNLNRGFGISILASGLGLLISARQVLMHIAPDDAGFGTPLWGYHLYAWAFLIFIVIILVSGTTLVFARRLVPAPASRQGHWLTRTTFFLFGGILLANIVVVYLSTINVI